jgi:hypothetical protein
MFYCFVTALLQASLRSGFFSAKRQALKRAKPFASLAQQLNLIYFNNLRIVVFYTLL